MLHIILLILKILGFLILGILALILLVLFIVLLNPFMYSLKASGEDSLESIKGEVRFRWLFRLLSGRVAYENGAVAWQMRIAWKKYGSVDEDGSQDEDKGVEKIQTPESRKAEEPQKEAQREQAQKEKTQKEEVYHKGTSREEEPRETTSRERQRQEEAPEKKQEENLKRIVKKKNKKDPSLSERFRAFWDKIKYTFQKICDNIRTLGKKKDKLIAFTEDAVHRSAFSKVIKELQRLLRTLCPQKADVWLKFGFEDPALTGYALAMLSLIYPYVGEYTRLQPDFENKVLKGKAYVKGKIRVVHILIPALSLLRDKNVRITYHHIRRFRL